MKLGENEAARELMARLIEMLQLEAEEERADGLPPDWIGMISRALTRTCPGGQVSILLGGRQANGLHALVIAELEKEWQASRACGASKNTADTVNADRAMELLQKEAGTRAGSGSIEVDSVAGLGTTFTIHLPEE